MKNLKDMKDLEKNLVQSKKAVVGHIVFLLMTVIAAFIVWVIWSPDWWVYPLILSAGLFGLIGGLINI